MGFNSAFKGLKPSGQYAHTVHLCVYCDFPNKAYYFPEHNKVCISKRHRNRYKLHASSGHHSNVQCSTL